MTLHLPPVADPPPHTASLVHVLQPIGPAERQILTGDALHFLGRLARRFEPQRQFILEQREQRQAELDAGGPLPDFPDETRQLRASSWRVAPIPADLRVRRVEITGPVDRKMIINALNSGADVFMADLEDSNAPTWRNCIDGQVNLYDAVRRTISYASPDGKQYRLNERTATLMVRPRGWHLEEKHVLVDGRAMSASLFDFGLYLYHNADALTAMGAGPYFYLPKLEGHLEARLWNDVFVWSQRELGIPQGTIRATVLIETILAAFEMDEILWELRDHSAGLNCGRWDYIFSLVKKFSNRAGFVLSDRALVTMTTPFMRAYSQLAIKTCHRRGIHAIGGMAAQIPIKNDATANDAAIAKVRADKLREVTDGHDGTWVAHPGLVPVAMAEFARMPNANQLDRMREDLSVSAADLLTVPQPPTISEDGLRTNIRVGIQYLESWLRGSGCVPINNLMEDAATAEISRAQLWQWVRHKATLADDRVITLDLVESLVVEELSKVRDQMGPARFAAGQFVRAASLFQRMTESARFPEFLTSIAYREL
ncbi:MAG TPA: malate synthase A [Tepidisphaeraceae bacterium]|nr:malate synthase A [Tepidisphaeraceae bacterium]